ncbi:MAG: ParB N-terminal domain-containing protein [Anaerolineae bacterium]|nr:ParB N-terminal domain-containing protein [Anaerolineae bacterium]
MSLDYPNLQILPTQSMVVHEQHDLQRTSPLIDKLKSSGVLRNPPIVTPLPDESGRFMVLDGANRTTALKNMGLPHVIAQVVEPDSPAQELKTWNHVVWDFNSETLIEKIREINNLDFSTVSAREDANQLWEKNKLAWVQTASGQSLAGSLTSDDLVSRVNILNSLVDTYKQDSKMDRTQVQDIRDLNGLYDNLCALVVFPPFSVNDLLKLSSQGLLLPTGITRFSVSPRALRVNFPLDELAAERELEEKNAALERWLHKRIARKGVRYYSEATVLYDE